MTTLPQTTGARFPRAGNRAPSIPALAQTYPGAAVSGGGAAGMTLADVIRVLRANALLIIICTLLSMVAGFLINQFVFIPYMTEYTARTVLQVQMPSIVDPNQPAGFQSQMDRNMLEIRQKTLAQKLQSPDLWRPLFQVERGGIGSLEWMNKYRQNGVLDMSKAIEEVSGNLGVSPTPQTELIHVSLSAPTAKDAKIALDAICDKLISSEQEVVTSSGFEDRKALQQLAQRINTQMAGLDQAINNSSALINQGQDASGQGNGLSVARQIDLQQQFAERIRKQTTLQEAEAEYASFTSAVEAGGTPAKIEREMDMSPSMQRVQAEFDAAELQLQAALVNFSEENRQVKMIRAQRDAAKAQMEKKREEMRVTLGSQYRDMLAGALSAAKADVEATNQTIASLEQKIGELNAEQLKFNMNKQTRDYLEIQKQRVDERLQILDANASRQTASRGTVRKPFDVEMPQAASFPKRNVVLAAAAVLGLTLSLGIAFLRELMDTSVRSPRDIARVGQINLLGMIPHTDDDPQAANGEISLIISQEPHSIIAENFRQVRTRLQHTASLDTTRSLLITSPGPGDGKTTIACNIAAGLALNGRKILLVDANFRRPALHTVFGVTNEAGLGSVLAQSESASSLIHKTSVPNLDVLTTGPRPANTTELLESQLLTDFIDRTLEEYDHVIFDAGPILLVSETVALAPRVDGVITVVRARANSRGLLQRMRDALRQLKAEHLGVVLNGVRQHSGGYYRRNIKNYYAYQNGQD